MNGFKNTIPAGFVSQPLFTINKDGIVVSCNTTAASVAGLQDGKLPGKSFSELFIKPCEADAMLSEVFNKGTVSGFLLSFKTTNNKGLEVLFEAFCDNPKNGDRKLVLAAASILNNQPLREEERFQKISKEIADYKYALDESSIVAITDQKGIIKHVNNNFCKISKYSREELLGNDHRVINSGYHSKEFIKNLWVTIANGNIWKGELKNKAKDGTFYWVDTTIVPFLNENGKPYQYVAIREDITTRKDIEEQQKKTVREIADYKYALDESSIVAITDQKGIIKHVNDNFCKISKYSKEELLGSDHRIINSGFHSKEFIKNLWVTIANGSIWKGELKNKAKDGTFYWVDTTIVPFLNEAGKPYQYVAIREDITSRKKIEEQQILYQQIIRSSDDAIISTDLNGIITSWNRGAEHIFDYITEEALGKNISMIIPREKKDDEKFIFDKIRKGESVNHYETIRVKKYGPNISISLTVSPIKNSTGEIIGASKIARDISEQKRIEDEIKKLNDELEIRVKERTEEMESFSYSVSHDLRAPLRAVNGYAKILEEDYNGLLDKEGKRLLNEVQQNAKKMGVLIDDLLAFSRLGRKEVEKSLIDMNKLTGNVVRELSQTITHTAEIKLQTLIPVMADFSLLQHVMVNLISNAVKYSSTVSKPVIEINSTESREEVIYSIKDNGVGFNMEYANKLFGVFQRLHSHDEFPGTGVGLAIVQRIIHKHKGRVWAEGEEGKGATFYFTLPLTDT